MSQYLGGLQLLGGASMEQSRWMGVYSWIRDRRECRWFWCFWYFWWCVGCGSPSTIFYVRASSGFCILV